MTALKVDQRSCMQQNYWGFHGGDWWLSRKMWTYWSDDIFQFFVWACALLSLIFGAGLTGRGMSIILPIAPPFEHCMYVSEFVAGFAHKKTTAQLQWVFTHTLDFATCLNDGVITHLTCCTECEEGGNYIGRAHHAAETPQQREERLAKWRDQA